MNAYQCKSVEQLQSVFDEFFQTSYALLVLYVISPFLPIVNYLLEIPIAILKILQWNLMFDIGGEILCSVDNNSYGQSTVSQFDNGSAYYINISVFYFLFDVFFNPLIYISFFLFELAYVLSSMSIISSGLYVWWIPFLNLIPVASATLWWVPIIPYYISI